MNTNPLRQRRREQIDHRQWLHEAMALLDSLCRTDLTPSLKMPCLSALVGVEASGDGPEDQVPTGREQLVLVVDDDEDTREMLRLVLEQALPVQTVLVSDGADALRLMQERRPDAVLLDLDLPVVDGFQVCRIARAHELLRTIPIVAMTALGTPIACVQALRAGCDDCLQKPFEMDDLLSRLRQFLVATR